MTRDLPEGRRHGVPEGRTERIERKVRLEYPDGTVVDSEPTETARGAAMTWSALAAMLTKVKEPSGTIRRLFTRTVVVEASPWAEVVGADGEDVVIAKTDQGESR